MTGDISKLGQQIADDVTKTLVAEIVKKVSIDDGDILIVKVASDEVFDQLQTVIAVHNPNKKFLLINQDYANILREVGEEEMAEYGWVRSNTSEQIEEVGNLLPESEE